MEFVHSTCLQNWIAISSRLSCEVCMCRYRGRKMCKYGVLTSIIPYVKSRWYRPKLNFLLLFIFLFLEQTFLEAKDYYCRKGKYSQSSFKCRLLTSILFRWLDYLLSLRTFVLMTMAVHDWTAWRKTQIVFVLDGWQ